MQAKITVVAVAEGYSFSGWTNYRDIEPIKPPKPDYSIDYINEKTNEDPMHWIWGVISLTPGSSLYFLKPVSDLNFKSNIKELIIPERPLLSTSLSDPVTVSPVTVEIAFNGPVTGFSEDDIYVSNGTADSLTGNYTAYITPMTNGSVFLFVPANVVEKGNFTSFNFSFQYKLTTGIEVKNNSDFYIYPTRVSHQIHKDYTGSGSLPGYEILDLKGITVGQGLLTGKYSLIAVHELSAGMYLLELNCDYYYMEPIWFLKK